MGLRSARSHFEIVPNPRPTHILLHLQPEPSIVPTTYKLKSSFLSHRADESGESPDLITFADQVADEGSDWALSSSSYEAEEEEEAKK